MTRPPRLPGFSYSGRHRYFLTTCAFGRRRLFESELVVGRALMELLHTAAEERFAVLAYCFMPDHLHALLEGADVQSDLRMFVSAFKRRSGRAHAAACGTRMWQEGYHDRILRPDEDPRRVARYILENPVRAGLVRTPEAWPHLGSGTWSLEELLTSL